MDFPNMSVKSFEKYAAVLPTQHCMIERDPYALRRGEKTSIWKSDISDISIQTSQKLVFNDVNMSTYEYEYVYIFMSIWLHIHKQ